MNAPPTWDEARTKRYRRDSASYEAWQWKQTIAEKQECDSGQLAQLVAGQKDSLAQLGRSLEEALASLPENQRLAVRYAIGSCLIGELTMALVLAASLRLAPQSA